MHNTDADIDLAASTRQTPDGHTHTPQPSTCEKDDGMARVAATHRDTNT